METELHKTTSDELRKIRRPLHNVNRTHKESLTKLEKFSLKITNFVGSMGFFIIILIWTLIWLSWNTIGPKELRFDPYPAFVLWLFISNMIQIFLMPLIMIGQNLQGRHSEQRAESDFDINVKAEKEIDMILLRLDQQNEILNAILKKIELKQ